MSVRKRVRLARQSADYMTSQAEYYAWLAEAFKGIEENIALDKQKDAKAVALAMANESRVKPVYE